MRALRIAILVVVVGAGLAIAGAAAFFFWARQPEIAGLDPAKRPAFEPALVAKGAQLAALGDCDVCHTLPGGPAYAGSRPIPTPFGTVYSANITPDPASGIGTWPEAAFRRAMRSGVTRRGNFLYPAFPYDHYTRLSDDDLHALYAFVMTRAPVASRPPPNDLPFPLNQRWLLAGWDLLYLDRRPFRPDPHRDEAWNRGAYLVEGLGHCGDCHTPRNALGAERDDQALAGGVSGGWRAPALTAASPAPVPWSADQLFAYLRRGEDPTHGAAAGPMLAVTHDLGRADEADVRAIVTYLASLQGAPPPPPPATPAPADAVAGNALGATLFAGACAGCHAAGRPPSPPAGIDLAQSTAVNDPDPSDAIFIVEDGIHPPEGQRGPLMPRFAGTFTDAQLAALLGYLRARYSRQGPWRDIEHRIAALRQASEGVGPAKERP